MYRFVIIILVLSACKGANKITFSPDFATPAPPVWVYKTKADYNNLVPVVLSDDKAEIIAYPHPSDLLVGDTYPVPSILNNGYLLDNRGINKNIAFIKLTYQQYAQLKEAPSLKELDSLIIDRDPLTELCNCGNKKALTDPIKQLNRLIDDKKLRTVCRVEK